MNMHIENGVCLCVIKRSIKVKTNLQLIMMESWSGDFSNFKPLFTIIAYHPSDQQLRKWASQLFKDIMLQKDFPYHLRVCDV